MADDLTTDEIVAQSKAEEAKRRPNPVDDMEAFLAQADADFAAQQGKAGTPAPAPNPMAVDPATAGPNQNDPASEAAASRANLEALLGGTPAPAEGAAPAAPAAPAAEAAAPAQPEGEFNAIDVPVSIARGVATAPAHVIDTANQISYDVLNYLGWVPEAYTAQYGVKRPGNYATDYMKGIIGEGDTTAERAIESLSGQIAVGLAASWIKPLQAAGWFARALVGNAAGAAAMGVQEQNLSQVVTDALPDAKSSPAAMIANAALLPAHLLATEEDDATFTRWMKHTFEGVAFEAILTKGYLRYKKYRLDKAAAEAGAREVGIAVDEGIVKASDELAAARAEKLSLDSATAPQGMDQNMPERSIQDAAAGVTQAQSEAAAKAAAAQPQKPTLNVTPDGTVQPQNYDPAGGTITVEPDGTALLPGTPTAAPRPVPLPAQAALQQASKRLAEAEAAYKAAQKAAASASRPAARAKAQAALDEALKNRNAARAEVDVLTPSTPVEAIPQRTKAELIAERRALYDELRIASEQPGTKAIPKKGQKVKLSPKPGEQAARTSAQEIRDRIAQIKEELKTAPKERPPTPEAPKLPEEFQPPAEIPLPQGTTYPHEIPGIPPEITAAARQKAAAAAQRVAEAQAKLVAQFKKSTGAVPLLRAQLRALAANGQLSPEAAAEIEADLARRGLESHLNIFNEDLAAKMKAEARLSDAERVLLGQFESSNASPRTLRAHLSALQETGQLSPELSDRLEKLVASKYAGSSAAAEDLAMGANPKLGKNAQSPRVQGEQTKNALKERIGTVAGPAAVKKTIIADHLELDEAQVAEIADAFKSGDMNNVVGALSKVFDVTNFDKIAARGDIKSVMEWIGQQLGPNENTFRLQMERSLAASARKGEGLVEQLARETGDDAAEMNARLLAQFPGQDLTRTVIAYRMFEMSVVERARTVAQQIMRLDKTGDTDIMLEKELFDLSRLSALINDRRAGLVSDIGRALHSMRLQVSPLVDVFRKGSAELNGSIIDNYLMEGAGGRHQVRRMAKALAVADINPDKAVRLTRILAKKDATLGDALHAYWISNLLSGPLTHAKNILSTQTYMMLYDTSSEFFSAAYQDAVAKATGMDPKFAQNMTKWAVTNRAKWAAWRKVMSWDVDVRTRAQEALKLGRRVTANPEVTGGIFSELGEGNYARATGLAQILRGETHFKGHRLFKGFRVLPRSVTTPLADALDASAQVSSMKDLWRMPGKSAESRKAATYGAAANLIDLFGRLNSWPLHALATADELNAGIARAAALEGEAFGQAIQKGLKGEDALLHVRDMVDNIHTMETLAEKQAAGLLNEVHTQRLTDMVAISQKADDYVRKMTFTQPADKVMQFLGEAREMVPGGRWNLVFVRTPGNIFKTSVTESPLWTGVGALNQLRQGNVQEAAGLAGKATMTSLMGVGALQLMQSGHMTSSGPLNPDENDMWRKQGHKPYALEFHTSDGQLHSIPFGSYVDPIALPLQVVAEFAEAWKFLSTGEQDRFAAEISQRMIRLFASKTYLNAVTDWMHSMTNGTAATKMAVRITSNFVPQSRLLAFLHEGETDFSHMDDALIDMSKPGEGTIMSLADYKKTLIDTGVGYTADENGQPVERNPGIRKEAAFLISTAAEPLPDDIRDFFINTSEALLKIRLEHQRFADRDLFYRTRLSLPGTDTEVQSSLHNPMIAEDPVVNEMRRVGLNYSTRYLFDSLQGIPLSPEQRDAYHQFYNRPTKDSMWIRDRFEKLIKSEAYTKWGENVAGVGKGKKYNELHKLHMERIADAQFALMRKYPELKAMVNQKQLARKKLGTKEGTDALQLEDRKSSVLNTFMEALTGGSN